MKSTFFTLLLSLFSFFSIAQTIVVPASVAYCSASGGGNVVQRYITYNGGNNYTLFGTLHSNGNRYVVLTVRCGSATGTVVFSSVCQQFQGGDLGTDFQIDYTTDCPINQQYVNIGVSTQCDDALLRANEFGCSAILPVELANFRVARSGNNVQLNWQTSMETNSKSFIIQRKTNGDFTDLATVAAKNMANGASYDFSDGSAPTGVSQYRLKIVDLDGSVKYSAIRTIRSGNNVSVSVYPNPSRGNARITVSENGDPVDVLVIDNNGKVVKRVSLTAENTIDLNNLKSGTYIIKTINKISGETSSNKLVVTN